MRAASFPSVLALAAATTLAATAPCQCATSWQTGSGFGVDGEVHCAVQWDPDGPGPLGAHLVIGGVFVAAGGVPAANLAMFDLQTGTWSAFGSGAGGAVEAMAIGSAGELVVGGAFQTVDGVQARGVARRQGGVWQPLGTGVDTATGGVRALLCRAGGEIIVGGKLANAGGVAVLNIARWDGSSWSALGAGLRENAILAAFGSVIAVSALVESTNGFVAVGAFDGSGAVPLTAAAEWNGTAWSQFGSWPGTPLVRPECIRRTAAGEHWICGNDAGTGMFVRRLIAGAWTDVTMPTGVPLLLCTPPNGDVILQSGGNFGSAWLYRWGGSSWATIGVVPQAELGDRIYAVEPLPALGAGALVVGGRGPLEVSGCAAQSLLTYRPASGWQGNDQCLSGLRPVLHAGPEGQLLVANGGYWGTTPLGALGQWTGASWAAVPGVPGSTVNAVAFDATGRVLVSTQSGLHRWNGTTWTQVASGIGSVGTIVPMPDGTFVVANPFSGTAYRWTGSVWQGLNAAPHLLALHPDGRLIGAGYSGAFPHPGRVSAWNGTTWSTLDPAVQINGVVNAMAILTNGDPVVAGAFSFANRIARWDGAAWQPLGAGFNGEVTRLCVQPDGRLVAGGSFTASGAVACNGTAIWDGQAWQALPGAPSSLRTAAAHPDGTLWSITRLRNVARLVTPCPANAQPLGNGCASSNGDNRLQPLGWPMIGANFRSVLQGLPTSAFGISVLGASTLSLPLAQLHPLGQPGCVLDVAPDVTSALLTATGLATIDVMVPNQAGLLGLTFHHQAVVIELTPVGALGPFTSTNSRTYTIGGLQ